MRECACVCTQTKCKGKERVKMQGDVHKQMRREREHQTLCPQTNAKEESKCKVMSTNKCIRPLAAVIHSLERNNKVLHVQP